MRTKSRRPIAACLLLVGATFMLAGCGDEGAHLPAGMTGSNAAYMATGTGGVLDSDPGPLDAGVRSGVDDPVLDDVSTTLDDVSGIGSDDPFTAASNDWNDSEGSVATSMASYDDLGLDEPMPVGYGGGYGSGWGIGNAYGYGTSLLSGAVGGMGMASFNDPGIMDAGFDPGFDDPGIMDAGFDPGFDDPGIVDAGFDAGAVDVGGFDPGFDAGAVDVGGFDPGFDAGAVDVGGFDPGFDAGIGF